MGRTIKCDLIFRGGKKHKIQFSLDRIAPGETLMTMKQILAGMTRQQILDMIDPTWAIPVYANLSVHLQRDPEILEKALAMDEATCNYIPKDTLSAVPAP